MIPILVLKTENKVIYNKSNLNCKTFFEEFGDLGNYFGSPLRPFCFSNFEMYYFTSYCTFSSECWCNRLLNFAPFTYRKASSRGAYGHDPF